MRTGDGAADVAEVLDGTWQDVDGHRFVVVDRVYRPGHRHGRLTVADSLPPSGGLWPTIDLLARNTCREGLLFLDLETTGLMGGAGTYAFLVGCAWFEGGTFRVRQYLMSSVTGERGLLRALTDVAERAGTVVTYNGKTFDLPLIETRFLFHRLTSPFTGVPHVDMLHPARRLWRPLAGRGERDVPDDGLPGSESACRLGTLERTLCGFEREGDVPGHEIPDRYFSFVRGGDARPLAGVLEHNRLDLLSLAFVTARACAMLDQGVDGGVTPREALGLGRIFQAGGRVDEASRCFAAAGGLERPLAEREPGPLVRAEALRAYALLARRTRRFHDAATAWRRLLEVPRCPPPLVREANEALAVHYEHRQRDLATARAFAIRSLQLDKDAAPGTAIRHRVARLDRKLGLRPDDGASLF